MKPLLTVFFLFSLGCATPSSSSSSFFKENGYVAIPLKKNAVGHFEIKVKINNVPGTFTLDTGASTTAIDKGSLKKFNITKLGQTVVAGGLGTSNNSASIIKINRLEMGSFRIRRISIISTDLSQVNEALSSSGVDHQDGVIGADVLRRGKAIIDYSSDTLFLHPLKPGS